MIELKTETRTIEGLEVTVTQLPASRALVLLPDVAKLVASALGAGVNFESSIGSVLAATSGAELHRLVGELLANASVVVEGKMVHLGNKSAIDMVFSGRVMALLASAWFSIQLNYADFFGAGSPMESAATPAE